nr:polypeptide N-acetylgalactosaminyltransferase 18-like [Macaca nemestrina]
MVCTRKTKTLVSTCVILSGMTNIICLLYVGWVTNYIASVYVRGQEPAPDKKLEEDKGDTLKIIERLDHLENVIKQHIQEAPAKPEEAEAEPFTDSSLFAHWGQELSPEGRRVALKQFQYYGYNAYLSDRLPLDRPLPDLRPSGCRNLSFPDSLPEVSIVFIFVNEALSVLLRSIHSAIERTPPHLLKEIILVDDNSSNGECQSFPRPKPCFLADIEADGSTLGFTFAQGCLWLLFLWSIDEKFMVATASEGSLHLSTASASEHGLCILEGSGP